ncbi:UNVERIFIED_CONTAM: hypothetical protein FKN15_043140 [Acipenser sinensis]
MNTHCPPKRVPSADRFFTHCGLTMQPPKSYSVGGQHSSLAAYSQARRRPHYRSFSKYVFFHFAERVLYPLYYKSYRRLRVISDAKRWLSTFALLSWQAARLPTTTQRSEMMYARCCPAPGGETCQQTVIYLCMSLLHPAYIDECAAEMHYCHANTVCVNLPGSHHCDCIPGYIRVDDFSCTEELESQFFVLSKLKVNRLGILKATNKPTKQPANRPTPHHCVYNGIIGTRIAECVNRDSSV